MAVSVPGGSIGAAGVTRHSPGLAHLLDVIAQARPAWHADALCREYNVDFFDESPEGMARAKAVCAGCAVVTECRAAADEEWSGVWGGLTPRERAEGRSGRSVGSERPHGTRGRYNLGCRCGECREACAAAMRERRARASA
ncbi:MAG: WhiB family transcriptional regulator [Actinomycetota bacterium]|nr:WhiB family transcriptional regulator [Actinomycetota bacterium]